MKGTEAATALQGAMHEQACQWIARLRSETASEADYEAFALWLAASPEHRAAMDAMLNLWDDLAVVRYLPAAEAPKSSSRRRWFASGLALAACLCLALVLSPRLSQGPDILHYQTRIGEQLSTNLEDGSSVRLNTDTSLDINFDYQHRLLTLHRGEAFFQVAHDPERPFIVEAGSLEVRALGTAFSVKRKGDSSVVTVTEGVVRVTERNAPVSRPPQTELLYPDQQLAGLREGLGEIMRIDADSQLAWRDGKLIAEDMPLAVLVDELSRYHPQRIFIAEPHTAQQTVSGVFRLEDLDSILLALEHTAKVRSVTLDDGSIQLIGAPL